MQKPSFKGGECEGADGSHRNVRQRYQNWPGGVGALSSALLPPSLPTKVGHYSRCWESAQRRHSQTLAPCIVEATRPWFGAMAKVQCYKPHRMCDLEVSGISLRLNSRTVAGTWQRSRVQELCSRGRKTTALQSWRGGCSPERELLWTS